MNAQVSGHIGSSAPGWNVTRLTFAVGFPAASPDSPWGALCGRAFHRTNSDITQQPEGEQPHGMTGDDDGDGAAGTGEFDDFPNWPYRAPATQPPGTRLTLALLEDLSRLLIVHGYPPLRGRAIVELAISLQRIDDDNP